MWLFYPPVVIVILVLAIRYGGLRQLTAVNPAMKQGGLIDLDKASNLLRLQAVLPDAVARTALIKADAIDREGELWQVLDTLQLDYPIILKPNSGQRGLGVAVIENREQATDYLQRHRVDILVQEYLGGAEFGVFYMREPYQPQGYVFSITHKQFPQLTGDGHSSLEKLILEDDRAHYMARFLLRKHAGRLHQVLEPQERLTLVEIGSHCRGSLFVDGKAYLTPELECRIDEISKSIPGFYFGRYDLRVPSIDHLKRGQDLKIIEANGLTSESTNIYDPRNSLFSAYKTLFRQWNMAFKISRQNRQLGARVSSYDEIFGALRAMAKDQED